jgi:O-antigen/teichoic acid export membrane protein
MTWRLRLETETGRLSAPDDVGKEIPLEIKSGHGRQVASGTLKLLSAQALALVAGLLTAVFLTRQLGPGLYGLYAVAATIIVWVQISVTMMFSSTTVKFVAEAKDWQAVASTLAKAQLFVSLGAAALLVATAPTLASWLRTPELAAYLRLFAMGIPLFALARVHRSTLIGRGSYGRGALVTASYWLGRLLLVFLLVGLGLSVTGAILASIGASLVHLIVARLFVRPALLSRTTFPFRRLAGYALPLFFHGVGMRLFIRVDLLVVKALCRTPAAAGYYGAAQNLTMVPVGMLAASFVPLLLATLTRLIRQGRDEAARTLIGQAIRLVLCLLPFAGLAAGAAPEIVELVYGSPFSSSVPLLAWLIFAALAIILISISTMTLTAAGRPGRAFALSGPLVPLALGAHLMLVPRFGLIGAAAATTVLACLAASVAMLFIYRQFGVYPAPATLLHIAAITLIAYALSSLWQVSGVWIFLKLLVMTAIILICLYLLGVLTRQDLAFARSLFRPERRTST